jgi:hypothetical protein
MGNFLKSRPKSRCIFEINRGVGGGYLEEGLHREFREEERREEEDERAMIESV